ncbi:UDP-N-acetylmuramate--L-alanine ligase [Patescibacteria group bacterium]
MNIFQAKHIHFTGIKGVGMTALALCAQDLGKKLSGSDVEEKFVTDETLLNRKIIPQKGFSPENIKDTVDLLIYTGAHGGPNNPEVMHAVKKGISCISHAEAVGQITQGKTCISVCGVGGKTSTSAMISTILDHDQKDPSYLVGVAKISSLESPGKYAQKGKYFVVEADEYATAPGVDNTPRFMHQNPKFVICTNISHDHPDVYPTFEDTKKAYISFFSKTPDDGLLVVNSDDQESLNLSDQFNQKILVGKNEKSHFKIIDIKNIDQKQHVFFIHDNQKKELTLSIPGEFNAKNALMSYALCTHLGLGHEVIRKGLEKFRGTNRRFEKIRDKDGITYFDDYAHHPQEIKATLRAAKEWLSEKRLVAIFQPHTYSRTKSLLDEFATSFEESDIVIITDIFPSAREKIDPTVSSKLLADKISQTHSNTKYVSQEDLIQYVNKIKRPGDAIFTIGAGDVYKAHQNF